MEERCQAVLDNLETYLDRQCRPPELAETIAEHLADCPACLQRVDFQRALRTLIATKCRDVAPAGLVARVQAALDE